MNNPASERPSMMRSSEAWVARIVAEFGPAVVITDMDMHVLSYNKEASRLVSRLGASDAAAAVRADILLSSEGFEDCRRRLAQQGRFRVERKHQHRLSSVWIEWTAREFVHDHRSHCLWTGYDVTRWKKSEAALLANELRLEALATLYRMQGASTRDLLKLAVQAALGMTHSSAGYIASVDENAQGVRLEVWAHHGELHEDDAAERPPFGRDSAGPWAAVLKDRRAVIDNAQRQVDPHRAGVVQHALRHLSLPVFDGDKLVLIAGVGDKGDDYDEQDEQQLSLFMSGVWPLVKRCQSMSSSRSRL